LHAVFRRTHVRARPSYLALKWPTQYGEAGSRFAGDQILQGFRELGIRGELQTIPQKGEGIVVMRATSAVRVG
jgi:hypothetical protein